VVAGISGKTLKAFLISFSTIMVVVRWRLIPYALFIGDHQIRDACRWISKVNSVTTRPTFSVCLEPISIFSGPVIVLFGIRMTVKWIHPELVMALSFLLASFALSSINRIVPRGHLFSLITLKMFIT
jgi:hypothetical protein